MHIASLFPGQDLHPLGTAHSGHVCLQVTLESQGYAPQRSQRNMDVNEPLQPGVADSLTLPLGKPLAQTATITLGMVPYQEGWVISTVLDVLPDVQPERSARSP